MHRAGTFAILLLAGSCTPSKLIGEESKGTVEGVAYHLPLDIVEVTVTESTTKRSQIGVVKSSNRVVEYDLVKKDRTYALATRTVADTSTRYRLQLEPGSASADDVTIATRPNGLLESINATSIGKAGDVVKNIASIVGTVAGAAIGLPKGFSKDQVSDDVHVLEGAVQILLLQTRDDLKTVHPGKTGLNVDSNRLRRSLSGLPREMLFVLSQWEIRRIDWIVSLALSDRIDALSIRRAEELAKSQDVASLTSAIKELTGERTDRLDAVAAQAAPVSARLVPKVESKTYLRTIRVNSLRATADYESDSSVTLSAEAAALRDETGLVVTHSAFPVEIQGTGSETKDVARIYYRQPLLVTLTSWQSIEGHSKRLNDSVVALTCAASPIHHLEFKTNAFAKRSLVVQFDEQGRLKSVKKVTTSSAAGSTGAIADGLTTLQDSLEKSITKSGSILAARNKVEIDRMAHDLALLEKEKAIVDARVALAGASASVELKVQQAILAAQLATLQAEVSLGKEQAARDADIETAGLKARLAELQSRLALEKAEKAAQSALRIDQLTQEVALLRKEIELLAVKKALGGDK